MGSLTEMAYNSGDPQLTTNVLVLLHPLMHLAFLVRLTGEPCLMNATSLTS